MCAIKTLTTPSEKWTLLLAILLVCCGPILGSWCVLTSFVVLLYRLFVYDISSAAIDIVSTISFAVIFKVSPGGISLLLYYILIADLLFLLRRSFKNIYLVIVLLYFLAYLFLRSDFCYDEFITIGASILFLTILYNNLNPYDISTIAWYYCLGLSISICYAWIMQDSEMLSPYIKDSIQATSALDVIRFKGLYADPNYFGTFCLLGLAIILQRYLLEIEVKKFILFAIILLTAAVMTISKTVILVIILLLFILVLYTWKNKNKGFALLITLLLLIFLYMSFIGQSTIVSVILERFGDNSSLNEMTTGRSDLWQNYALDIVSSPKIFFMGHGINVDLLEKGTHNIFLEVMYYIGLLGLLGIIYIMYCNYKLISKRLNIKLSLLKCLPLIVLLISYFSLQGLFSFAFYIQIFLVLTFLITERKYA